MYPTHLKYSPTYPHQWVKVENKLVTIGITEFVQERLADIIFVELPEVSTTITKDKPYGTIESVKATLEAQAPISGKIVKVNQEVIDTPWTINEDPYNKGWLMVIEVSNPAELKSLLDAHQYHQLTQRIIKEEQTQNNLNYTKDIKK